MFFPRDYMLSSRMFHSVDIDELTEADTDDVHGRVNRHPEPGTRRAKPVNTSEAQPHDILR